MSTQTLVFVTALLVGMLWGRISTDAQLSTAAWLAGSIALGAAVALSFVRRRTK